MSKDPSLPTPKPRTLDALMAFGLIRLMVRETMTQTPRTGEQR